MIIIMIIEQYEFNIDTLVKFRDYYKYRNSEYTLIFELYINSNHYYFLSID